MKKKKKKKKKKKEEKAGISRQIHQNTHIYILICTHAYKRLERERLERLTEDDTEEEEGEEEEEEEREDEREEPKPYVRGHLSFNAASAWVHINLSYGTR